MGRRHHSSQIYTKEDQIITLQSPSSVLLKYLELYCFYLIIILHPKILLLMVASFLFLSSDCIMKINKHDQS